ncbi:SpvB/TcaC N-terminal domain-containing protein [Shewanella sp. T24-MNA-CIBAN-0130]|uniref:SpvB/TcaC N-terminal domain-containing protein n=1 Tax=Shewanella sp. T24-MNA-CIBAN-0130 TaxID=3140470 RepID=UPI00331F8C39
MNVIPAANQSGSATITITVSDGSLSYTRTFVVTVNAVNDTPTISNISNRSINEDSNTGIIAFTIGDHETAAGSLSVSRSSSNTALVPTANVILGGSGANRTVSVTPVANQAGKSTISITVSDGSLSSTVAFVVTVNAVDDLPIVSLTPIPDLYESQSLFVTASASDNDSDISAVEFSIDNSAWYPDTSSPYNYDFGMQAIGIHQVNVRAKSSTNQYSSISTASFNVLSVALVDINEISDAANSPVSPEQSDLVGEIKGNAGVDGGAFSYSVPLTIAPGRKGVQPSLSLNYNSQSGEGIAGMGWSLSANSSISRCSNIYDLDDSTINSTFSVDDKICYNGSRLVAVSPTNGGSVGQYGTSGTYYQTERDGSVIVQQLGGGLNSSSVYFVASEVNGTQHLLGQSSNSRIVPVGLNLASTWLQDTTRDTHSNEISYQYDEASAGNRYLLDIFYTGYEGVLGTRNIHFDYKKIPSSKGYQWGGYSVHDRQLMSISMNIEGQEKATWRLNYQIPTTSLNDAAILDHLQYCDTGNNDCLTTEFGWFYRQYKHNLQTNHALANIIDNYTIGLKVKQDADYDGDGVTDLSVPLDGIYLSRTGNKITYQDLPDISSRQWAGDLNGDDLPSSNEESINVISGTIDYDLDGADDFVYTNSASKLVFSSFNANGSIKSTYTSNISATCYATIYRDIGDKYCTSHAVDINGDGRKDILLATNKQTGSGNNIITYKAYLRSDSGSDFVEKGTFTAEAKEPLIPMDVDGDGVVDLAPSQFHKSLKWYKVGFNPDSNTVSFIEKNITFNVNVDIVHRTRPSRWVDLNGDGLSDILTLHKVNSTDSFYTRYIIFNKGNGLFEVPLNTGIKELAFSGGNGSFAKDPTYGGSAGYVHENFIQFIDYNGDGRQDILYPDYSRKQYLYECWNWTSNESCRAVDGGNAPKFYDHDVWYWNVLLTNPDGKSFTDVQLPVYGALATLSPIDLTGDGRVDFISGIGFESDATKRTWFYGSKQGGKPPSYPVGFTLFAHVDTQDTVIKSIKTGMGEKLQLDYTQLKNRYPQPETTEYPYVNFTNTMRVVATLKEDNGLNGVNKTEYSYKNARFHVSGRGFQGFSDIIETNTDAQNLHTLTTETMFSQTFPWSGTVLKKTVKDGQQNIISEYQVDKLDDKFELVPGELEYLNGIVNKNGGKSWCFYPKKTTSVTKSIDPNTIVTTVKNSQEKNRFCQTTLSSTSTIDNTIEHNKSSTQDYTDIAGWSMPTASETNQSVAYTVAHEGVILNPANTATSQKTTHIYNDNTQELISSITEGTGTLKGVATTTTYSDYDQYGNASKVSVGDRYNQVAMTNDGYFVYKTFNAQWSGVAVTTNTYDPLTGQVLTSVDMDGVTTTNQVNFIGMVQSSSVTKGALVIQPTNYVSLQWETGDYAYKQIVQADGQPQAVTYFDSLGRPVKQVTDGFEGEIISETAYDARGNIVSETKPTEDYGTQNTTQFQGYDALGRPARKIYNDGMVSYQSEYDYGDGITTNISVSGGLNASMSRSYNSLGQLLSTTDAKGNKSYFAYNAAGLPVLIQDVLGSQITARYDDLGRKAWFNDPNMGVWNFTYNQYGELVTQKDARNITTTFNYDKAGRQTSQTGQQTRTWVYDANVGYGKLYQAKVDGHIQTHSYDTAGRIKQTLTAIGSLSFTEKYAYDSQFGRIKAMQYPSGEHVAYRFDDKGYLIEDYQRFTDGSEQSLRIIDEYSAFGSINQQTFSNHYVQQFSRNLAGSPTSICTSSSGGCSTIGVQYLNYDYDGMGNLAFQHNVITQFKESYNYDELMRVDDSTKTYKGITYAAVNYDYDAAGNILVKGDYGSQYLYGSVGKGAGGNAGPNAIRQFIRGGTKTFTYDNNGNRLTGDGVTLTYNDQNKPLTVDRNNVKSTFSYDANGNRYKQVKQQSGSVVSTTYYVGSFEREVTLSGTVDKTYIGDHTIKMKAHVGSLGNQSPFQHVLRDHLGSVDTLMDAKTGAVLQHRGYDVFGRPRDIASGNSLLSGTSWQGVTKGYTDHEHLIDQELIHMNGRIYDFNVGRFLSVDPFLQFPENSQSANPYSYILNNPMSGVDPTGYRSEELDEVISGKAFEKLEKDESGNLYVTADGETYKLTSVSNGEKNFSISFDGNGGGTAQVGKVSGAVNLHKGDSGTNVDSSGLNGTETACFGSACSPSDLGLQEQDYDPSICDNGNYCKIESGKTEIRSHTHESEEYAYVGILTDTSSDSPPGLPWNSKKPWRDGPHDMSAKFLNSKMFNEYIRDKIVSQKFQVTERVLIFADANGSAGQRILTPRVVPIGNRQTRYSNPRRTGKFKLDNQLHKGAVVCAHTITTC